MSIGLVWFKSFHCYEYGGYINLMRKLHYQWNMNQLILLFCFLLVPAADIHAALLPTLDYKIIADSEEPIDRRIYSYDLAVDNSGTVHIVYLQPTSGDDANVYYQRRVGTVWSKKVLLTLAAYRASISTRLVVDSTNVVHVCYIKNDLNLYYRSVVNNVPGTEYKVGPGAWHTRMQLDDNNHPMFIRENETWPEQQTRLVLVTTSDGTTWSKTYLNLPPVNKFRIGEFLYKDGTYHVTYGDGIETRPVLAGKGATTTIQGLFHNLYYATSTDGQTWSVRLVDDSRSLYENEFWTALALDNGTPLVAMYKYAEYGGQYNTGTSALLAKWNGDNWIKKNITPASYPATREGMGVGIAVRGPGDYYGAWDFSPDNTYDDNFRGARGNIAVAHNGADGSWSEKWQLAPFSAEGEVKVCIRGDRLYVLALGDFVDAKLYFWEIDLNALSGGGTPSASGLTDNAPALPAILMLLH